MQLKTSIVRIMVTLVPTFLGLNDKKIQIDKTDFVN